MKMQGSRLSATNVVFMDDQHVLLVYYDHWPRQSDQMTFMFHVYSFSATFMEEGRGVFEKCAHMVNRFIPIWRAMFIYYRIVLQWRYSSEQGGFEITLRSERLVHCMSSSLFHKLYMEYT